MIPQLEKYSKSQLKLYKDGIAITRKLFGLVAIPDMSAGEETAFHSLYKETKPVKVKGLTVPKNFVYLTKVGLSDLMKAEELFCESASQEIICSPDPKIVDNRTYNAYCHLFYPLYIAEKGRNVLSVLAEKAYKVSESETLFRKRQIEVNPKDKVIAGTHRVPSSYVPSNEWFDKSLDNLQISDILGIFPKAEQELLSLGIGRTLCGANGEVMSQSGKVINHAYRSFLLLQGQPQVGKSTLMELVKNSLTELGYTASSFHQLNQQYGMNEIAESNLAYCDDLSTDQLKKNLEAPLFKQMVSGSEIRSQVKFASDVQVRSKAVFFACINKFDFNILYNIDDGSLNRICILKTRTDSEIEEVAEAIPEDSLSYGSTNIRPYLHIKYLAEKTGTSVHAVMCKFFRLCADNFLEVIENDDLDRKVNTLKTKLKTRLHQNIGVNIASVLQLAYCLRHNDDSIGQLNPSKLMKSVEAANFMINDLQLYPLTKIIKDHWVDDFKRGSDHPWVAIEKLDTLSLASSSKFCTDNSENPEVINSIVNAIKGVFSEFRLNSGYNFPSNVSAVKGDWNNSMQARKKLKKLIDLIKDECPKDVLDYFQDLDQTPNIEHIFSTDYDRQAIYDQLNCK